MSDDILRNLQVERWPVSRLKKYGRNARKHSEDQLELIMASMRAFRWTAPILVSEDGTIIAGHARFECSRRLKLKEVPVIVIDGLSETDRRALTLAENQIATKADWDIDMLTIELGDLQGEGVDIGELGFDQSELDAMMADTGMDALGPDEPAPAQEKKAVQCPECGAHFVP